MAENNKKSGKSKIKISRNKKSKNINKRKKEN